MAVAANANALATVAEAKYAWGRVQTDTSYDDRIQTLINQVSGAIAAYCGRIFQSATYTSEEYDGIDGNTLFLDKFPITAVTSVTIDDVAVTLTDATTFKAYLNEGYLWHAAGWHTANRRGVKVTYTAGYSTIPEGIKRACVDWVILLLENGSKDSDVEDGSVKVKMPESVVMAMAPYIRMDF